MKTRKLIQLGKEIIACIMFTSVVLFMCCAESIVNMIL